MKRRPDPVKRSMNLLPETDEALDRYRQGMGGCGTDGARGQALDTLGRGYLSLQPSQAAELARFAEGRRLAADLEASAAREPMAKAEADARRVSWDAVAEDCWRIARRGHRLGEDRPYRRIPMDGRALMLPDNDGWVVLNEEFAPRATRALVVSVDRGEPWGLPHYVLFNDIVTSCAVPTVIEEADKCCMAHGPFAEMWRHRVHPAHDSSGAFVNEDEFMRSPVVGHFDVAQSHGFDPAGQDVRWGPHIVVDDDAAPMPWWGLLWG